LSWDDRVSIQIEDHYYDNSDAAVVFKRVDRWTGDTRYIYHGNDGTSMPWNDTAQLNFLNPKVREAVIQTILQIAKRFPVIRFDAAMTLTKKHFQRLWYPEPGSGGDIPSRAGLGMTKEQFNVNFPIEFWREVVDRINQEIPDTLLLAEAFWLMEGYFVRTLGMHRVYNSAFMNMLRDEKNQEYRQVIKNTIEFDPEILKRYVNFMNNPDERTAVDQFGKGDKYFGVCTMMVTMPGLPMFGHGQVEGFTEKYGMEYQRAYWNESPDDSLIDRHEREIFPLMHRRRLFANVDNFYLYDFYSPQGYVNEDVFAYSNRMGDDRALVIYHNKYASARGWIRSSVSFPLKVGETRSLVQTNLGNGLNLPDDHRQFVIFRDHTSGLEYIRNCQELHKNGLYIELDAYKSHVFLDFRIVTDTEEHPYANLEKELNGKGIPSMDEALQEMLLRHILLPFRDLINAGQIRWLIDHRQIPSSKSDVIVEEKNINSVLDEIEEKTKVFLTEVLQKLGDSSNPQMFARDIRQRIFNILQLPIFDSQMKEGGVKTTIKLNRYLQNGLDTREFNQFPLTNGDSKVWCVLICWAVIKDLGKIIQPEYYEEYSISLLDEWRLWKIISGAFKEFGVQDDEINQAISLIRLMIRYQSWRERYLSTHTPLNQILQSWLNDPELQNFAAINHYQGKLWFNKECFEELLWWFFITAIIELQEKTTAKTRLQKELTNTYNAIRQILDAEILSEYEVEKLINQLQGK
ncbi:MAG: alpha-amylase, partial [Chloroflexi bacterium]|nr:alpha-amylase [Chloroflexota bacterium]